MKKLLAILLAMMLVMVSAFALATDVDDLKTNGGGTTKPTGEGSTQDEKKGGDDITTNPDTTTTPVDSGSSSITVTAKDPSVETGYDAKTAQKAGLENKVQTVTVNKHFTVTGYEGKGKTPAHTLEFVVGDATVTNATTVKDADAPKVTIDSLELSEEQTEKEVTIHLPVFPGVGVYTYPVEEKDTGVAGITYATNLELKITVIQGENALVIAGIALKQGSTKTDTIENLYDSGALKVGKKVTGNMGDQNAVWEFKIDLKAPDGDTVKSTIAISGEGKVTADQGETEEAITGISGDWDTKTVYAYLKHGQSVEFDNLPAGVTYTVTETVDSNYEPPVITNGAGTIAKAALADAEFTNKRDMVIDTGVTLETSAYVLIMALALAGFVMLKVRRREEY